MRERRKHIEDVEYRVSCGIGRGAFSTHRSLRRESGWSVEK